MSESQKHPCARTERLVTRRVDKELLVYDLDRDQAHCLNDTAARVWQYCDGRRSVREISELLSKDLGTAVDEMIVWNALVRLQKTRLLDHAVVPQELLHQAGRREAIRMMALASAVAVPLITSIVAPTPAQAASGGPPP